MERNSSEKVSPVQKNDKKQHTADAQERGPKKAEKKSRRFKKAPATSAAICTELEKKKQKEIEGQEKLDKETASISESVVALHLLLEKKRKQAEKKKRRIEKALATSAAICAELEKKKQKKIEEQQRLDKECAAIAESVALHVLEEDTQEFYLNVKSDEQYSHWNCSINNDLSFCRQNFLKYSGEGLGWATDAYDPARWNSWELGCPLLPHVPAKDLIALSYEEKMKYACSTELIVAQAVSSLKIAEDSCGHGTQLVAGTNAGVASS